MTHFPDIARGTLRKRAGPDIPCDSVPAMTPLGAGAGMGRFRRRLQ